MAQGTFVFIEDVLPKKKRKKNLRAGNLRLHLGRHAAVLGTVTPGGARGALLVGRVDRVEPEHVGVVVVPDAHDEDHGQRQGLLQLGPAADLVEAVAVAKDVEDVGAVLGRDGARRGEALERRAGHVDALVVLHKELRQGVALEAGHDAGSECLLAWGWRTTRGRGGAYVNFLEESTVLPLP